MRTACVELVENRKKTATAGCFYFHRVTLTISSIFSLESKATNTSWLYQHLNRIIA